MTDTVEAVRQDVDQEAADELARRQTHDFLAVTGLDAVVLPAERDGLGVRADQAVVRDRDPVGVAAQIGQHRFGAAEGRFGAHHPFRLAQWRKPGGESLGIRKALEVAEERQLACAVQRRQPFQEQSSEQPGQNPDREKEPGATGHPQGVARRQAPARHDHVDVRMVGQRGAPGMQDARHADADPEAAGIGGDGRHGLGRGAEQQPVDLALVPMGDPGDLRRQGEDHVEILHRQQIFRPRRHPVARRRALALGAVPVLARVVGDVLMTALRARGDMPAEHLGAAGLDG